jgi:hypothetical protein
VGGAEVVGDGTGAGGGLDCRAGGEVGGGVGCWQVHVGLGVGVGGCWHVHVGDGEGVGLWQLHVGVGVGAVVGVTAPPPAWTLTAAGTSALV